MRAQPWSGLIALVLTIAALVGVVDAAANRTWDLVAIFGVIAILGLVLAATAWSARPGVGLRRDLVRWMAAQAAEGGERVEDVADRAVAAYRAGLTSDPVERRR